ncbi:MAG: hypothetical protein FJ387_29755 [Verrucomicrobia bacterium]|nr:hypothetical protein [Verrucomicrobiota bacterium]
MKTTTILLGWLATLPLVSGGEFVNLSFEAADPELLVPHTWGYGSRMVPGWLGDATVGYNQGVYHFGVFMIIDEWGRARSPELADAPIVGNLAIGVVPNAHRLSDGGEPRPPVLQQRGLVPADARALLFVWKGERLRVLMDGAPLSVSFYERRPSGEERVPFHDYYAADVSAYAGQEATLRFEFRANEVHAFPDWPGRVAVLDGLEFSAIPEPAPRWLLLAGLWWLAWRCRRAQPWSRRP